MTKDNIIGIVIILAILIGFSIYMTPGEEERKAAEEIEQKTEKTEDGKDTIDLATDLERLVTEDQDTRPLSPDSIDEDTLKDKFGVFASRAEGKEEFYTIENNYFILTINTKGGFIQSAELKNYKTWDQNPLMLFHDEFNDFSVNFFYATRLIQTNQLYFEPYFLDNRQTDSNSFKVEGKDSLEFSMRLNLFDEEIEAPRYIEFYYKVSGNDYLIDFDIRFIGMQDIMTQNDFLINWDILSPRQEKSYINEQRNTTIYYQYLNDDVSYLSETRDVRETLTNRVKWVSFKQQFFSIALIAENNFLTADLQTKSLEEEVTPDFMKQMSVSINAEYDMRTDGNFPMSLYFGPNHYQTLSSYDLRLERQIPLGWSFFLMSWINRFLVIPVFNWLDSMNLNYGLIIFLLTIMLKIILLPIAYKTYISSAKMRVLKPEIDELGKKFPKKEDAMKKQQATMALYKKAGVNPMAGCIPMLLQLPILLALFRFFPASIELRQEAFLWADDLSSYDSILDLPFAIPFYGSHVSLFTILMAISTVIYTRMNSQMMSTGNQMPGMKMMLYFMPIMMIFIFNGFASGLSYYYFLANVITFGQMFLFRTFINEDKLHAKIEENKKKPVKQSKWQQKMQQLAQEKQAAQKRRK